MHYDYDEERYVLDIPTECPKCGNELELDVNYDSNYLLCCNPECDYTIDVTNEFKEYEKVQEEGNEETDFSLIDEQEEIDEQDNT